MSIDRKVQEALAAGVPMQEIQKVLGNNVMKAKNPNERQRLMNAGGAVYKQVGGQLRSNAAAARNARVGGAMLQGGLKGIGTVQSNLAQGIGQAGLNNRSFSPTQSALSPLGDAAAARGEADAQYQKDLSGIAQGEQARADRLAREEADREVKSANTDSVSPADYARMEQLLREANPHIKAEQGGV